jgi:phosphoserine phosphatase RsbU/P
MTDFAGNAGRRVADLQTVLEVTRDLAATTELTPLLQKIERAALQVLQCERASVFLYDPQAHELYSRLATGVDEIRFSADQGIAGEAARKSEVIIVADAYADKRFNPAIDRQTGFTTRNMVTFPLRGFDNSTVGVLQVLNKKTGQFDAWDRDLVETLGAQIGVVLQRQLLLEEYAEKQRIQADLNIAREIQQRLLPKTPPAVAGFDIAGWNKPADETGGDCFDFIPLGDGSLAITIADATGHGVGPALVIAECRALFRATVLLSADLAAVVSNINNLLCADLPTDRFVTAFFGILSSKEAALRYISAGHGPLIQYIRREDRVIELKADTVPLGIMPGLECDPPQRFVLEAGDLMVLLTDGFAEWIGPDGEQVGQERLHQVIRRHRDDTCAEIIQALHRMVLEYAGGTHQADDLTAVIIKKL